jgi:hypothetical protein
MRNEIETSDLFRGAYLLCCGARVGALIVQRGQVRFVIEGEDVGREDMRYRTGCAQVNPIALRESLNLLRDLMFERLREKEENFHAPSNRRRDRAAESAV